ncbi:hypothetical protein ACFWC9_37975 [Streptomyces goshikiensis]|uniref:hypothetical protein n=1 Tax=Streptomyces goshikiensis TaxID=1942 RepID=UPI0036CFEAB3
MHRSRLPPIAATGIARVVSFDDVSRLLDWQSDPLCAAVTGRAMSRCGLEEPLPVGTELAFILALDKIRADPWERTVAVGLSQLAKHRPETELWKACIEARPRILGALPSVREKADRGESLTPRATDYDLVLLALEAAIGGRAD